MTTITTTRNRKPSTADPIATDESEIRIGKDPNESKLEDLFRTSNESADGLFGFAPSEDEVKEIEVTSRQMRDVMTKIVNDLHRHSGNATVVGVYRNNIVTKSPAAQYLLDTVINDVKPIGDAVNTSMGTTLWRCSRLNAGLRQLAALVGLIDAYVTLTQRDGMAVTKRTMQALVSLWDRDNVGPDGSEQLSKTIQNAETALRTLLQKKSGVRV